MGCGLNPCPSFSTMTNIVSVSEAKLYMRVDFPDDDVSIESLLNTAQVLCRDVARLSSEEWENIVSLSEGTYNGMSYADLNSLMKSAVLYALSYLFEHREEADHHELTLTLRSLLFSVREGVI